MRKIALLAALVLAAVGIQAQPINAAKALIENEDYAGATKLLKDMVTKDKKDGDAMYWLGETFYRAEKSDSSKVWWMRGADEADNAACQAGLGKLFLDDKKTKEAGKAFDVALRMGRASKNAAINSFVGMAYMDSQNPNFDEAAKYFTAARDLDLNNVQYKIQLGDAYYKKNQMGDAMNNYEEATRRDPKNPDLYVRQARIWSRAKQPERAIAKLEECVKVSPTFVPGHKALIEAYSDNGKYDKVTTALDKYVSLVTDDVDARARLTKFLCYQAKNYDRTIEEANRVLKADPNQIGMFRWLAWAQYEKGDFQNALNNSKNLFAKIGDGRKINSDYEYYAKAAQKLGDLEESAKQWNNLMAFDTTKDYSTFIANMFYEAKKYPEAAKAYQTSLDKNGFIESGDCLNMAYSYYSTGDLISAEKGFLKLTELSPTYMYGHQMLCSVASQLDSTKTYSPLAYYQKMESVAAAEPAKNKSYLIMAYDYITDYYYTKMSDIPNAIATYEKRAALSPEDASVQTNLQQLRAVLQNGGKK